MSNGRARNGTFVATVVASVTAASSLLTLDRLLKNIVVSYPAAGGVVVTGWLNFRGATNPALAFSLPFPKTLLPAVSLGAIALFAVWWANAYRRREAGRVSALTLILAGASSNLLDRLRWGHVVDYLDVPWFTVFNFADVMISVGVGLLIANEVVLWWRQHEHVTIDN